MESPQKIAIEKHNLLIRMEYFRTLLDVELKYDELKIYIEDIIYFIFR